MFVQTAAAGPVEKVDVEVVKARPIKQHRLFDARIEAIQQSTVSAQTNGRVVEILFDVDDTVEKGAILIRLYDKEQKSRLDSASSSMKEAAANFDQAEKELRRIEKIYQKKLVSRSVLDKAIAARKAALARLNSSRAKVAEAREQWEHTVVRAPYSGIVVKRSVQLGEAVRSGQSLMTGLSLEHLRAVVDLPQGLITLLRQKAPMFVRVSATQQYAITSGNVTVFPYADTQSHTFRTRLKLPVGIQGFYPGMMIKAGIQTGERNQLSIPLKALVQRSEVTAVYILNSDMSISFRQVRTGYRDNGRIQILAGLREGDKVILDPVKAVAMLKNKSTR